MRKKGIKSIELPEDKIKEIQDALKKDGEVRILHLMRIRLVPYKGKTFYSGVHKRDVTVNPYTRVLINPLLGLKKYCKNL